MQKHHWIVFNFLKELKSALKCVPNVPLGGQGGLRFPPNTLDFPIPGFPQEEGIPHKGS